jgi:phosphatidate cytidylyltransferase
LTDETPGNDEPRFNRPWEREDTEDADVVSLPGLDQEESQREPRADDPESDDVDWDAIAREGDEYTSEEYIAATTQEYVGLAEEVSRASEAEWKQQAVAATLPGVESGLVGFEDVSGTASESEESLEAYEQAASSDLTMRIASALVIFGVFLGSLLLGGWWFASFVILVMVVAVGELYANLRTRGFRPLALFGLVGVILIGVGAETTGVSAIAGWAAFVTVLTILFYTLAPRRNAAENASVTVLGMAWVGLLAFAIPIAQGPRPVAYIVFVVLLVALNDIGAYFVGRSIGRRRMAPEVSPNKTIEGLIGGLIVGAITASVMVTFPAWEAIGLANGLVAAAVVGVFSPLGDLVESMVKRTIDVKDMGSVLPGHGGMLDRIDGFLFAVPAIYFLFRAFGLL